MAGLFAEVWLQRPEGWSVRRGDVCGGVDWQFAVDFGLPFHLQVPSIALAVVVIDLAEALGGQLGAGGGVTPLSPHVLGVFSCLQPLQLPHKRPLRPHAPA
eukprot:CAMPEP_0173381442 /NCGR_PEP_ID=MMETSP1356-20130122/3802_1 /TAXON_ID=77927 ORGANISM="Hemiselmis virescens, Strain PCC157" /NCGR_SAMPLE_ID=MMETSP1356 /ASSEMBLY_ACC=CAM_ASM_000847 /LENGTH=100 /DNA_ID=CAMNT_0014335259 /DNA_START=897 /DNA_END=1195 /DNA_ORIENTATION=+